jgi:hypothetical protein
MHLDIRRVGAQIWKVLKPAPTSWEFVTSDGVEASVGTPLAKLVSGGGAAGSFFVQGDGQKTIYRLPYVAVSIGFGLGTPVSFAYSDYDWPAQGLGKVWKVPLTLKDNPPYTFQGRFIMASISASTSPLVSSNRGAYGVTVVYFGGNLAAYASPFCTAFYKYAGILYGSFAATPGAGLTFYAGNVGRPSVYKK